MYPVSRVNSSFSRVNSHKRRVKGASGYSLRHTLLTLVFRVLSASVNMLLGALREQQQLRKGCFDGKLSIFEGSRDWRRKRHEKRAVRGSLLHNLIALASMVRTATLNMQLGVRAPWSPPRQSAQAHPNCWELWKELAALKQRKQPHVRHSHPRLGCD